MEESIRSRLEKVISSLEETSKELKDLAGSIAGEQGNGFEGNEENADTLNEISNWISQHNEDIKDILDSWLVVPINKL